MLTVLEGQEIPSSRFSKRKVRCRCSCGNPAVLEVSWSTFSQGAPACGKCTLFKWRLEGRTEYGRLRLACPVDEVTAVRRPVPWDCACGRRKEIPLFRVISGNTRSCGCAYSDPSASKVKRTNQRRTFGEWALEFPDLVGPREGSWTRKSRTVCTFRCGCGREFQNPFGNYRAGKTCGKCGLVRLERGYEVRGFRYDGEPVEAALTSTVRLPFTCPRCGGRDDLPLRYLVRGEVSRCGHCNEADVSGRFGRLTVKEPRRASRYSTEKVPCVCDCGSESSPSVSNLVNGVSKSCGRCRDKVASWYLDNREEIRSLSCPLGPGDVPAGGVAPIGVIRTTREPFPALCPACGHQYGPRWEGVRLGVSLTCGCTTSRVSFGQLEIGEFLRANGVEVEFEHSVNSLKYDMCAGGRMLIEYNGLKWHSMPESRRRDLVKYENAVRSGYRFMSVFEDEWLYGKEKVKALLMNRFSIVKSSSLRPSKCEIRPVSLSEADSFHERFHYIGSCRPKISYGVFLESKLVCCASFSRPTRQSKHDWELVRMASDPEYRVHGIWSKLLKRFIREHDPQSIVSFSDNRLFSGEVYERMGFRYDGEVPPSYYWARGQHRFHKSALRKTKGEKLSGLTERELREAQGYRKIWDLGKKRWVWIDSL